jgi:hypothetical protein
MSEWNHLQFSLGARRQQEFADLGVARPVRAGIGDGSSDGAVVVNVA